MARSTEDTAAESEVGLPFSATMTPRELAASGMRRSRGALPEAGTHIGRYLVISKLGAGAMGVVLAAYDPELDRKVAIKLLKAWSGSEDDAARKRLQREAKALARLNHSNVVAVYDVGVHEGQVFVAMEFVSGQTLGAWMDANETGRDWREVLLPFIDAGRGLAAAHAEGLIHRDFKPDNVMLGDDGRVRVMDFGLARAGDDVLEPIDVEALGEGEPSTSASTSALEVRLTRTGAMMGTPAYMAPEQMMGQEVTAASDQFSYCVTLFEALYGVRPFAGNTLAALAFALTQGRVTDPPRGATVPRWLAAVVRRGLSVDPADRHPDMNALLSALAAGEARRRRTVALAAVGVLAVGLGSWWGHARWDEAQRAEACVAQGATVDEIWNAEARASVGDGLRGIDLGYAQTAAEGVLPYLDEQAEALREAQTEACMDATVRGRWTSPLLERATWCLDEGRMQLDALATELSSPDPIAAQKAVMAAARLMEVDACRDEHRLEMLPEPPEDLDGVKEVRELISRAQARQLTGRYDEGLEVASEALARAEGLGWPALIAAARLSVGSLHERKGQYPEAEAALEAAYFEAAEVGATGVAAEAAVALTYVVGYSLARHTDGQRWGRLAQLALDDLGEPEDGLRQSKLDHFLATIHWAAGEYEAAEERHTRLRARLEGSLGPEHPALVSTLVGLALTKVAKGDYEAAEPLYQRSLSLYENALGAEHPDVATTLNGLASVYHATGSYDRAMEVMKRVVALRKATLGPEHPDVAEALYNVAALQVSAGAREDAEATFREALALWEETLGPEHPTTAAALEGLASVVGARGGHEEAVALMTRSLEIAEKAFGPEHPRVSMSASNLAGECLATGDYERARLLFERALAIREKVHGGDEHPQLGQPLDGLAQLELARGRPGDALSFAERAVVVRGMGAVNPHKLAASRLLLARALWEAPPDAGQDRPRALRVAQQARDALREGQGPSANLEAVEAWLAEHPLPG